MAEFEFLQTHPQRNCPGLISKGSELASGTRTPCSCSLWSSWLKAAASVDAESMGLRTEVTALRH